MEADSPAGLSLAYRCEAGSAEEGKPRAEQWQARSRPPRARGASARCRPAARTPPCKMIKEHVIIIQRVLGLRFSAASARSSAASPRSSMSRNTCAPCKIFEGYVLSSKGPSSSLLYLLSSRWPAARTTPCTRGSASPLILGDAGSNIALRRGTSKSASRLSARQASWWRPREKSSPHQGLCCPRLAA